MKFHAIAALSALVLASGVHAQVYSPIPNDFGTTNAGGTFLGPMANAARTYQLLINESQLTAHVGRLIDGYAWRLPNSATAAWPTADVSFTQFDLRLSPSVAPASRSLTFASNVAGTQVLVKSGALLVPANSYPSGASGTTANDWGPVIPFDTPYLYLGGHLLIEVRHTGFSGTSRSVDAILATGGPAGVYGNQVSACWTGSYAGTSGAQGNFSAIHLRSIPGTVSVAGQVTLEDRVGNFPTSVDIDFKNLDFSVAHTAMNVSLDGSGNYSTTDLPAIPGSYLVSVKLRPGLRRTVGPVNTGTGASGVDMAMPNGDIDDDNEIAIGDYSLLSTAFGSGPADPNWDPFADLDGDDEVTIGDYAILSQNFGMIGDQ
ncbi:MAG TPA: hypothetical protein PLL78_00055 [Fimbriimonadaceae bacterium]|nr:hypothetical protein [Fimbriimonadaceae bacterium]HRJ95053.1 hypothetical protein [Fimbriimonadaceae bacterium]